MAKVPSLAALDTFLLLLGVVLYLLTYLSSFDVLLLVHVNTLLEMKDYLPNGYLLFSCHTSLLDLWHVFYVPCTSVGRIWSIRS